MFVDTHCHIHDPEYGFSAAEVLSRSREAGVEKMICVGTTPQNARQAVEFASAHDGVFAAVGVHPHDAKLGVTTIEALTTAGHKKVVAVGEIGLDYFYEHSPRAVQIAAFEQQLQYAVDANLPVIFHVRDREAPNETTTVWRDFWPVIDNFSGLRGVLHSFTDTAQNLERGLARGFYVSINGISTFTRVPQQQEMFASIPLERLLLETDAPFLTPRPFRGKMNEPCRVKEVALHQAKVRGCSIEDIAQHTSRNAQALFDI